MFRSSAFARVGPASTRDLERRNYSSGGTTCERGSLVGRTLGQGKKDGAAKGGFVGQLGWQGCSASAGLEGVEVLW
jgi:hypothetical protein